MSRGSMTTGDSGPNFGGVMSRAIRVSASLMQDGPYLDERPLPHNTMAATQFQESTMQRFCSLAVVLVLSMASVSASFAQGDRNDSRRDNDDRYSRDGRDYRSSSDRDRDRNDSPSSRRDDWRSDRDRDNRDGRDGRDDREARFGKRARIDALATDMYKQANSICWEMHRHYQKNRRYTETYADMYRIREAAKRIEELAGQQYYRRTHSDDRIERDLKDVDRMFHAFEDDVRRWRAEDPQRADFGGDLHDKLDRYEVSLHDLMDDYGVRCTDRKEIGRRPGDRGPNPPLPTR